MKFDPARLQVNHDVVVIGAGVSGLSAASALLRRGLTVCILEGRSRAGGRVLSVATEEGAGIDLGPAWLWPRYQPKVRDAIERFGLTTLPQREDGLLTYEDAAGALRRAEYPKRYDDAVRVQGGMAALVDAQLHHLAGAQLRLSHRVTALSFVDDGATVAIEGEAPMRTRAVIVAVPPVLSAQWLHSPSLPEELAKSMVRWPTWMAAQAKFLARYSTPFWRDKGWSGAAVSQRGPLFEVADHSDDSNNMYALFGFVGLSVAERQRLGADRVKAVALEHLARLFGDDAANPMATWLEDWSEAPLTSAPSDWQASGGHPPYGEQPLAAPWHDRRLAFCAAETDSRFGGLIEGALAAGERAALQVLPR